MFFAARVAPDEAPPGSNQPERPPPRQPDAGVGSAPPDIDRGESSGAVPSCRS